MTVLKAKGGDVEAMLAYYAGLAQDQQRRDGAGRGPVDYYLDPDEPPGRWWGAGRGALGLSGEVTPEQLRALLEGLHPETGKCLGRRFRDDGVRGFDATFSAVKSASVLWALSPDPWVRAEVAAAHDAAVEAALSWLERHGAVTRRGTDGVAQVDTQGLTVALFRQHTSRTADPQLHTHAVIAAKVQDRTGKWLSLDARFLTKQQRSIGWVYDAALRTELTARLGVEWGPVEGGQAHMAGVPEGLRELFSKRSEQVEAKLAELVRRWVDEHDGADPDPRTIARLERAAVLTSRPAKQQGLAADELRRDWVAQAEAAGFDRASLPTGEPRLAGLGSWDLEAVIATAMERVTDESSTWLRADLARKIATLLPADAVPSGMDLTMLIDELTEAAAGRCVEIHPPASPHAARRRDGRPVSEHVTDRCLTTQVILDQEHRLLSWAAAATHDTDCRGKHASDEPEEARERAAAAVAGDARLVLVVGPAGAGKTTTLAAAVEALHRQDRPVVGLAPSGKAADVLARESGSPAVTLAKLLYEHARPEDIAPPWRFPAGTTVILDEAGMTTTDDLDGLVGLIDAHEWRLACVGDPHQLPAVGRGGMFADWCEHLSAHDLEEVRRFEEPWQAAASLRLRRGDPEAAAEYAARGRVHATQPALIADRVARQYEGAAQRGESVAITTASAGTARAVNVEIQRRGNPRLDGPSVCLADGTQAFVGDRVATRRNDPGLETTTGTTVRNRQTWTVTAVHPDGSLSVEDLERGAVVLPARYVASHVELGWAITGYGTQGVTLDHGICVVEPGSTRAGVYVGMTRGRRHNLAWVLDPTGVADPAEVLATVIAKPPRGLTAHATRERLYAQRSLSVTVDTSDLVNAAERMRQQFDRLQTREAIDRPPLGVE